MSYGCMLSPEQLEERRPDWLEWPCETDGFPLRRPGICRCVTCQPGRAGGTPDGEDTPRMNVARMAAMEAALAADQVRQLRQPDFGRVETPPKTVIPFKEGERVSGITPDAAIQGYQQPGGEPPRGRRIRRAWAQCDDASASGDASSQQVSRICICCPLRGMELGSRIAIRV